MYLKDIEIENVGPIDHVKIKLPFNANGSPKPLILVGRNGCGKTILLSYIANFIFNMRQQLYSNSEIEKGKVFKLRSSRYIKNGNYFSFAKLNFEEGIEYLEWVLVDQKKHMDKYMNFSPIERSWRNINTEDTSYFSVPNNNKVLKGIYESNAFLYFPSNRYEEPGWINSESVKQQARTPDGPKLDSLTDRQALMRTTFSNVRNWIYDIIYDALLEKEIPNTKYKPNSTIRGILNQIASAIFADKISEEERIVIQLGPKHARGVALSVVRKEIVEPLISDLFQLSSGESSLFSLFSSIMMDYDLTMKPITSSHDIRGLVVIDEIDVHLHQSLIYKSLPKLIKIFPNVQFIITTHSPLFLLGMQKEIGTEEFQIINLPSGGELKPEDYTEYEEIKKIFDLEQKMALVKHEKVLLVEGDSDKIILETAIQKLNLKSLINFEIIVGYGANLIRSSLQRSELFLKNNHTFIGLFDFDSAFSDWNSIKWPTDQNTSEETGLIKRNNNGRGVAILLPVPKNRSGFASRAIGDKSTLSIEFMFDDSVLVGLTQIKTLSQGNSEVYFSGDKIDFAKKLVTVTSDKFESFRQLIDVIIKI